MVTQLAFFVEAALFSFKDEYQTTVIWIPAAA